MFHIEIKINIEFQNSKEIKLDSRYISVISNVSQCRFLSLYSAKSLIYIVWKNTIETSQLFTCLHDLYITYWNILLILQSKNTEENLVVLDLSRTFTILHELNDTKALLQMICSTRKIYKLPQSHWQLFHM